MKEEYRKIVNELLGLPEDAEIEFKGVTNGTAAVEHVFQSEDPFENAEL